MWKCYHETMNNSHFTFFTKLMQHWSNVLKPVSRRCSEFDVVVTTLYRRCQCKIHDMLWGNFFYPTFINVGKTLWFDALVSTFWNLWMWSEFQHCSNVTNTSIIVNHGLNLLFNVETTLKQRYNSDVVYWL